MAAKRKKETLPTTARKGDVVEFEIDDRPYHATGTIIGQDTAKVHPDTRYKILVVGNKSSETYYLYRFEFKVVG